jgi:hypothetical protein
MSRTWRKKRLRNRGIKKSREGESTGDRRQCPKSRGHKWEPFGVACRNSDSVLTFVRCFHCGQTKTEERRLLKEAA